MCKMDLNWFDNLPDASYEYMFGIRKPHFDQLRDCLSRSAIYNTVDTVDLGLYLFKLKHGLPNRLIACLTRFPLAECNSRIDRIRFVLRSEFADKYIGFHRINRASVITKFTRRDITHGLGISKETMFLIEDGIPYLIPNESDSEPRFLSLESIIVFTSSGLIVDVTGPAILEEISVNNNNNNGPNVNGRTPGDGCERPGYEDVTANLKTRSDWLQESDVIVSNAITRGLLDSFASGDHPCHSILSSLSNTPSLPPTIECLQPFVPKNGVLCDNDLSSIRNGIAHIRAIIRMVKHRIRSWKAIEKPCWQDRLHLNTDLINVCAIINYFQMINIPVCEDAFDPTSSPEYRRWNFSHCKPDGPSLLDEADFRRISKNQVSFPPMSREDIRDHTLEIFQVTRSYAMMRSMASESLGDLVSPFIKDVSIWEPLDNNLMLRVTLGSSHYESEFTTHFWYTVNQHETKIGWICYCDVGRLNSWSCGHVAAVFKDLGYRFHPYGKPNLVVVVR